ncbi:amino acid ABC transporter substrate-binding protein [Pseudomonas sp. AOB-7]|jgi:polar amino acid transport system substrate-binding protein|uniref:amino acid ABC transporter substrate-binding protein n=1 Tax=unclassified Pseudomonas TaxID=196821 RepID=UPI0003981811|nr:MULTISPECIES: amino acid ABC transporter substrate-binding protein [unclassified Pseudomonas]ERI53676.1 ABC transporter substrate-binding protein [Pseudomonas sp. EGD-AK9]RMH84341.1 amino acid ABC transporter substrate-binding protein [Pseudomonas sp. AOB-7]
MSIPYLVRLLLLCAWLPAIASAATLERIHDSGQLVLGFVPGNPPFSDGDAQQADGYAIELCRRVASQVQEQLAMPALRLRYQPLTTTDMLDAVAAGRVDILCAPVVESLERRRQVSFSLPIFTAGLGVVVRQDAPATLLLPLKGEAAHSGPTWRATINRGLSRHRFAVLKGTISVDWARTRIRQLGLQSELVEVDSNREGVEQVVSRRVDAFFADRLVLLNYQAQHPQGAQLWVPERLFEVEAVAMPLARDDEDFRLLVDTALSRLNRSSDGEALYRRFFGELSEQSRLMLRLNSRP